MAPKRKASSTGGSAALAAKVAAVLSAAHGTSSSTAAAPEGAHPRPESNPLLIDFGQPAQSLRGISRVSVAQQVGSPRTGACTRARVCASAEACLPRPACMCPCACGCMVVRRVSLLADSSLAPRTLADGDAPPTKQVDSALRLIQSRPNPTGAQLGSVDARSWGHPPVSSASVAAAARCCFLSMVRREQEFPDHVVFYHSYNAPALLYEVRAELARTLYSLPDDTAPLCRLLQSPFKRIPNMDYLLKVFPGMPGQDADTDYQAVAICATVSLFGGDSEAPPLSSFAAGYCATGGILRKVLISLLTELGASQVRSVCSAHMPRRSPPARSQPARGHERGRSARARGT